MDMVRWYHSDSDDLCRQDLQQIHILELLVRGNDSLRQPGLETNHLLPNSALILSPSRWGGQSRDPEPGNRQADVELQVREQRALTLVARRNISQLSNA
jgi:hypothetical protein